MRHLSEEKNFDDGHKKRKPNNELWKKVQKQYRGNDIEKIDMLGTVIARYWELPKEVDDILTDLSKTGSLEIKRKLANLMATIPSIPSGIYMKIIENLQKEDDHQIQEDLNNALKPLHELEESMKLMRKQIINAIPKDLFANFVDQQAVIQRALMPLEDINRSIQKLGRLNISTEQFFNAIYKMESIKIPRVEIPRQFIDSINAFSRFHDHTYSNIMKSAPSYYSSKEKPQSFEVTEHPLIMQLKELPPGKETWSQYQNLCEAIFSYCFVPPLLEPFSEVSNESGIHRRDLIFHIPHVNSGFWAYVKTTYSSLAIIIEAKNYTDLLPKDQIVLTSKYFGPKKLGNFGIIICRKGIDGSGIKQQADRWIHHDEMIVCLDDNDLIEMIGLKIGGEDPAHIIDSKIRNLRSAL